MTRGPIPKRSEERVRRNVDSAGPVEKVGMTGSVEVPELGDGFDTIDPEGGEVYTNELHPIAVDLYESMKTSGQSKYFEPSDWQMARVLVHLLSKVLHSSKPSAQMLAALTTMMSNLLLTEGDRRRVRLEVERGQVEAQVFDMAKMLEDRMKAARSGQLNIPG